ncbi:hypothetical protein LCGC14_2962750, partial [marine sediment metagenome]
RLNRNIIKELEAVENAGKKKTELTEVQEDILNLIREGNNVDQIATLQDRNPRAIRKTMEFIRLKGYKIEPVYDSITHRKVEKYNVLDPEGKENSVYTTEYSAQ